MQEMIKVVFKSDVIPHLLIAMLSFFIYILAFVNSTKRVHLHPCIITHYGFTTCFLST